MTVAGSWYTLEHKGYSKKFQPSKWKDTLENDPEFRQHDSEPPPCYIKGGGIA
jgi:hypothetical protein